MTKIEKAQKIFSSLSASEKRKATKYSVALREKYLRRLPKDVPAKIRNAIPYCHTKPVTLWQFHVALTDHSASR